MNNVTYPKSKKLRLQILPYVLASGTRSIRRNFIFRVEWEEIGERNLWIQASIGWSLKDIIDDLKGDADILNLLYVANKETGAWHKLF